MENAAGTATAATVPLDRITRFLHLGLAVFGVWAWVIGSGWIGAGAADYELPDHFWYTQHMWVGITFSAFLFARIVWGVIGPANARFANWVPWTGARFKFVIDDVRTLLHFQIPDRPVHVGLSGFVEALGLLAFLWLALSGLSNAITITAGVKLTAALPHFIKHWHQIGNVLVPVYLGLHVGATILHSLVGKQVWKKMLFME